MKPYDHERKLEVPGEIVGDKCAVGVREIDGRWFVYSEMTEYRSVGRDFPQESREAAISLMLLIRNVYEGDI